MRRVVAALCFMALGVATASADDSFGAVGVNMKTGFVSFATGYTTQGEARTKVEDECREHNQDCGVVKAFTNGCVALARSSNGDAFGLGDAATRAEAQRKAVDTCAKEDGKGCNIHDTVCAPENRDT
ncbi:MAG: DUF4189 domain-containing protein [Devosia sp.]